MTQATHSASTPNRRTIFSDAAAAISSPKAWEVQHQYGAGPDRAGKQQAYHQRRGEITFRMFKFRGEMREGFQTDKAPEHHRQRRKRAARSISAITAGKGICAGLIPPRHQIRRSARQSVRQPTSAGWRWSWRHANMTRQTMASGAQLRQQQLLIMPAEQRLPKTGGDVQRRMGVRPG